MTTNFATVSELQELARLAEILEKLEFSHISLGDVPIIDANGELLATYTYIGDLGTQSFVFSGQSQLET